MIFFWGETPDGWGIPGVHGPWEEDELDGYVQSGVYLIRGNGENLLIDSGNWTLPEFANGMGDFLVKLLDREKNALKYIFITHFHYDHVGNADMLKKRYGRYKLYAFALSGFCAGLAGALAVARLGAAGPTLGSELLLNTLAAIVVGGTSLSGGVGGVHRTLIGVVIIAVLDNGLNLMGVNQYTQMVIKGLVVVAAVLIGQDRSKIPVMK